ncbi:MAG: tRNA (pseudouridine(54)-N(1))-methyltransferase TrmY [Halolamina sp.]
MRQFLLVGHEAPTTPTFALDDLAGAAGRLDVLCRCVSAGLFVSHDIREDTRVHLVLGDEFTVTVDGGSVKHLGPDERNVAARIRDALGAREDAIGHQPAEPTPGVELRRMGFSATLDRLADDATVVQLHESGAPVVDAEPPADPLFVLSDHADFASAESERLAEVADERIRLGPRAVHADHAVAVAHNYLDTDGYESY